MLCDVTNLSRGPRGLQTAGGATALVEPGATARLDLADHALHQAWEAAGDIAIVPLEEQSEDAATAPSRRPGRRGRDAS